MNNQRRFRSKTEAFQTAVKVWTCKSCGTWHSPKKPDHCSECGFNDFNYFASKFEAKRFGELSLMQTVGQIKELQTQVAYPIKVNGVHICKYIADFVYTNALTGEKVVEDTKGHEKAVTDVFKLKVKLVAATHGVEVKCVYQSKSKRRNSRADVNCTSRL